MVRGRASVAIALAITTATSCAEEPPSRGDATASGGIASAGVTWSPVDESGDGADSTDADDDDDTDDTSNGSPCGSSGEIDFSYIWIANSTEGTVSKIDTVTAIEVGRYRTGPDDLGDPSRTSVNLDGDVVVANRHGGLTKIFAIDERCVDADGDGAIRTSIGPADVLPWGEDECVAWYQALPFVPDPDGGNRWGPRPVAWDSGVPDPDDSCRRTDARVWVGWYGGIASNQGIFRRYDGATGQQLDEVIVEQWAQVPVESVRPYGGATDAGGNFWILGKNNQLVRIDGETLEYEQHFAPIWVEFYGLTLDRDGEPWIGGCDGEVYHFDPVTEQFAATGGLQGCVRGLQVDEQGRAWLAGNDPCRLVEIDTTTNTLVDDDIELPGCRVPVGVSIDVEGYVWVVDKDADKAYKVDPDTHAIVAEVGGLVDPYSYSDMTGAGLRLVSTPEG